MTQPTLITAPIVARAVRRRRRFTRFFRMLHALVEREGSRAEQERAERGTR